MKYKTGDWSIEFYAKDGGGVSAIEGVDLTPTDAHKELAKSGQWMECFVVRESGLPPRLTVTCPTETPDGLRLRKIVSEGDRIISDELIPMDDWIA